MSNFTFKPGPETARAYRDALGCFGTGVTVVTTQSARGPLAITANSFTSVSLDPPLLLWCPGKSSLRHDAFVDAENFSIHIMAENQLDLALHFARNGDAFDGVDWSPTLGSSPAIAGVIARFDCAKHATYPGGDHSIVLGQVLQVETSSGNGLIFKRGLYGGFQEQP